MSGKEIEIKVKGIDEIEKALYRYSQQLGDKVVLGALKEGLKVIQKDAKRRAPKRTGRLRKNIVIRRSKIHSRRKNTGTIGMYMALRTKGKADNPKNAFYGRFVHDGWNTKGKRARKAQRAIITSRFGRRTGRKTLPGRTDVRGQQFIQRAFKTQKGNAVRMTIAAARRGSEIVARKTGLK